MDERKLIAVVGLGEDLVLKKCQVKSTPNQRACMSLIKVEETKGESVCMDRSNWKEVNSACTNGKRP
jgi:hypothetical protein